jgi:hypothetical protein
MRRGWQLALCCAAALMAPPLVAQDPAPPGAPAEMEAPVRVVVFEHLALPGYGLTIMNPAYAQLEREFSVTLKGLQSLGERINRGEPDAESLKRDYDVRAAEVSEQLGRRQKVLFEPIIAKVQASLTAYAAATGGGPIMLVGEQDIAGLAPEAIEDLTAGYIVWMNAQP